MAYEKLQGYLAQEVIVSDNTNIIYPSLAVEGTTSVPVANQLTAAALTLRQKEFLQETL